MHPQDPCAVCAQADTCRLKLNCSRYLRYREAKQQAAEDSYNLGRCKGIVATLQPTTRSTMERWQKAAKENPWVPAQEQMANKIDAARAAQLYADGLTDLEMAECLGVSRQAVSFWRRAKDFAPNRKGPVKQITPGTETGNNLHEEDKTMPNTETLTPHIMLHNATLLRIQHLLELRKPEDTPAVRGMFVDLSVGLLRDGLMAEESDHVHMP